MKPFLDARELPDGTDVMTDVCVIGAGAAGITIARDLVGSGLDVLLVESGGIDPDAETQGLAGGVSVGQQYYELAATRLRYFGGSTNHWAGWCAPLDSLDFAFRPWVPASGWPMSLAELQPYFVRAQDTNGLASFEYDPEAWASGRYPVQEIGPDVESVIWQFSPPTRYGPEYREALEQASNVRVVLHANVVRLDAAPGADHVHTATLSTLLGTSLLVRARTFVLACGGIENARLLLLSDDVAPGGLGNEHDLVGRFFMEHAHARAATCVFAEPAKDLSLYTERASRNAFVWPRLLSRVENRLRRTLDVLPPVVPVRGGLRLSDDAQRREGVLNGAAIVHAIDPDDAMTADVQRSISVSAHPYDDPVNAYDLVLQLEQAPNPDSRVTLDDEVDALGLRRTRLDLRLGELDTHTLVETTRALARAFGASGTGSVRFQPWVLEDPSAWHDTYWGSHHMGTTRMSDDPRSGVVDADCRVHGVDNLYIAGSSVFPTGGFVNPTLTLVALAHRLADHLRARESSA